MSMTRGVGVGDGGVAVSVGSAVGEGGAGVGEGISVGVAVGDAVSPTIDSGVGVAVASSVGNAVGTVRAKGNTGSDQPKRTIDTPVRRAITTITRIPVAMTNSSLRESIQRTLRFPSLTWRGVSQLDRWLEAFAASRWGFLIGGQVFPASLWVVILMGGHIPFLTQLMRHGPGSDTIAWLLQVVYRVVSILFYSTVVLVLLLRRPAVRRVSSVVAFAVALGGAFVLNVIILAPVTLTGRTVLLVATALLLVGQSITLWGLCTLRTSFSIVPEARRLVTWGPYAYVRHPMYVGEFISALGMTVPVISGATVAVFAFFVILQWRRMLYEEYILAATFADYEAYARRTARLIPRVW
jgi:protein-S-isoprenylcysteine O-methyltransferase Ste14